MRPYHAARRQDLIVRDPSLLTGARRRLRLDADHRAGAGDRRHDDRQHRAAGDQGSLGADAGASQWIVAGYSLAFACC
jgi:hypothetical protein